MIDRLATALCAVLVAAAGCGTEPTPKAAAQAPADLRAACGEVTFDSIPADPAAFPPWDEAVDPIDRTRIEPEGGFFDVHDWYVASRTESELSLFGVPHEPLVEDPRFAYAGLIKDGGTWVLRGWAHCRIEISAPGWGNAAFVLDPAVEPDPATTAISVLTWEKACASGRTPEGRQVRPVVLAADESSVSIVVLVEPVTGGADCPSNPSFPLEIELGSALGDRTVLDAGVQPAHERPWPPTRSSLSSAGLDY